MARPDYTDVDNKIVDVIDRRNTQYADILREVRESIEPFCYDDAEI
jgi:hypothetical protein